MSEVERAASDPDLDPARRRRLVAFVASALALGLAGGLATGSTGFDLAALWNDLHGSDAVLILGQIRAPRTLGAALVGALLGLSGAIAQGLFRNPLADPYLLGSASGAGLGVVLVLAAASLGGATISLATVVWIERVGLVTAAFAGSVIGVTLTLTLARGAVQTLRLLLAGVVVGVMLGAISDLVTVASPDALRGKQAFMLGSTSFLGWSAIATMGLGLALLAALAQRHARALDALTLGEDSATSLGLDLGRVRLALVLMLSLGTALAVAQAGLVAFVGLVAPHLVRRHAPGSHGWLLIASAGMGAALLLVADVISRAVIAPEELPVGVVTAVLGGCYLFGLLRQRAAS
ncbi:FecCD family ABC transporter permease [Piscinibacter koreensis]|uniref:Iron ABC transporter permease n=1 Tax=Piscinibacter koreensis TaxID=2742824 RepID=A0A7Y6NP48_9BURK|nr:iron ABC transporter permease [Schlegelella koreensis]NUZ06775.1 iron ABC transporter permease [Schlegelella koreensis]